MSFGVIVNYFYYCLNFYFPKIKFTIKLIFIIFIVYFIIVYNITIIHCSGSDSLGEDLTNNKIQRFTLHTVPNYSKNNGIKFEPFGFYPVTGGSVEIAISAQGYLSKIVTVWVVQLFNNYRQLVALLSINSIYR